ncbi:MAG TPA: YdcF family protein [Sediminibacterium sp.]|nr:YdcF family protein [Sediminibacterium sp.]
MQNPVIWNKAGSWHCYFALASCLLFLHPIQPVSAQIPAASPTYRLIRSSNPVQYKNYYLLTLFQTVPAVRSLLEKDPVLVQLAKQKIDSLQNALMNCGRDGDCFIASLKFSAQQIRQVSDRLTALYQPGNALGKLVTEHLIPSGCYVLFQQATPAQLLVKAWEQDAAGINYCISVYGEGNKPHYPLIDSISFHTRNPRDNSYLPYYTGLLYNTTQVVLSESVDTTSFFYPSLTAALAFLEMNEREQAGDFEPMEKGVNRAAFEHIQSINWHQYKYSLILIPGAGPDDPSVPLSAEGMLRCRLAALQYNKGLAPFIVTSGGKVHPYKTRYCEAIEMKKFLVEKLHIPASAVIVEPHARHTTTNMRNTVRLMYRYGIPFSKPGVTCTTRGQSRMIGTTLIDRCMKELNEVPYKNGERLSETLIEFYPLIEALQINPTEPMDP